MSTSGKKNTGYQPARMTINEFQDLANFFKQLIDSSNLKWAIIAAGIASVIEILHIGWLAARFLLKF